MASKKAKKAAKPRRQPKAAEATAAAPAAAPQAAPQNVQRYVRPDKVAHWEGKGFAKVDGAQNRRNGSVLMERL